VGKRSKRWAAASPKKNYQYNQVLKASARVAKLADARDLKSESCAFRFCAKLAMLLESLEPPALALYLLPVRNVRLCEELFGFNSQSLAKVQRRIF
jgi:hypothetical protein